MQAVSPLEVCAIVDHLFLALRIRFTITPCQRPRVYSNNESATVPITRQIVVFASPRVRGDLA
jgi:hypothetical protein